MMASVLRLLRTGPIVLGVAETAELLIPVVGG